MVLILSVRETLLWIGQQGEGRKMDYRQFNREGHEGVQSELDQEGQTECKWLRKGQEGILNKPGMEMGMSHTGHDGRFSDPF